MEPEAALREARRLDREGQSPRAVLAYKLALRAAPDDLGAQVDLAGLLVRLGRHEEALDLARATLAAAPDHPGALLNLAGACLGLERFEEAGAHARRLLQLDPASAPAHLALGLATRDPGHLRRARELDPADPGIRRALIHSLLPRRAWAELFPLWQEAIARDPEGPRARFETALLLLTYGRLEEGWEAYESRFTPPNEVFPRVDAAQPLWDGAPFPGRTLLLHYEQGFGDTLMFIRYAALARARGGRVAVLAQPPLLPVLRSAPGVDLLGTLEEPAPPFDLHLPLLSLPRVLGTRLDSIPAGVPYLWAPSEPAAVDGAIPPSANLKVGLVWAGSPGHAQDFLRTPPPEALAPLGAVPGVDWYGLQVGPDAPPPIPGLRNLGPLLRDFGDTARAMARLDLVVTVDTAAAHLAGALGRPVWLMLPLVPDWRWLLDREDSPWYPTMRLFRQLDGHRWEGVVARIADSLNDLMNARRGTC